MQLPGPPFEERLRNSDRAGRRFPSFQPPLTFAVLRAIDYLQNRAEGAGITG